MSKSVAAASKLTFYWNPTCPFVHRSLIAMREKGIFDDAAAGIDRVYISLSEDAPAWYTKINPKETVPTLVVPGLKYPIFESALIAEYFDRTREPINTLLPDVADIRAEIREFQSVAGDAIGSLYGTIFASDEEKEAKIASARGALAKVDAALAAHNGPFFLGSVFTLADVHIVPFLLRFSVLIPEFVGVNLIGEFPRVQALLDAARIRPSVAATNLPAQEYINAYKNYGPNAGKRGDVTQYATVRLEAESPFAARLSVAAAITKAPVKLEIVPSGSNERLPSVTYRKKTAFDSSNSLFFLLETTGAQGKALIPANAERYARAQFIAQEADEVLASAFFANLKDGSDADAKKSFENALSYLDGLIEGPFAVGEAPSFADAVLAPHLARILGSDASAFKAAPALARLQSEITKIDGVDAALKYDAAAFAKYVASA